MNINHVVVVGNLTRDPELRFTSTGIAVANLAVAVNGRKKTADGWEDDLHGFFDVNVWRDTAEHVAESLSKGDRVVVSGQLRQRMWEAKDGSQRSAVEIVADEVCPSLRWSVASPSRAMSGGAPAPSVAPVVAGEVPF